MIFWCPTGQLVAAYNRSVLRLSYHAHSRLAPWATSMSVPSIAYHAHRQLALYCISTGHRRTRVGPYLIRRTSQPVSERSFSPLVSFRRPGSVIAYLSTGQRRESA
eukprot:320368-Rhodomonas_salina.5